MLKKGQWEFKNFNNFYTQNKQFRNLRKVQTERRDRFVTSINQFLYGINSNLNVGFDIWLKSSSEFGDEQGYFNEVFFNQNPLRRRSAVTGIGPKIKIAPFKKLSRLSIQSTILIPLANDLESRNSDRPFLEIDRHALWLNQIFYDKPIGNDFQLFFQFSQWLSFPRNSFRENVFIETPFSVFFSWFTNERLTLYVQNEFWPTHYNDQNQKFLFSNSWFVQSGLGTKYQIIPGFLEGEISYTNFWLGNDGQGAGETYNFGIRIIN